jgi:hypothetical protein
MREIKTPKVQAPRFLNNLYRDMRDRRLLLPALALIVALIAVPIVLKTSSSSAPAPSTSAGGSAGQTAAEPAVLAEQVGVTDYRKRLQRYKTKNPFRKHFMGLPKSAKLTTTSVPGTSSVTGAATSTSSTSTTSTSTSTTTPTGSLSPATFSGGTSGGTEARPASGSTQPATSSKPANSNLRWFAYQASVEFGQPGNLTRRSHVKRLAFLPNGDKPMVAFLGVTQDAAKALFLISDDVSTVRGDGHCRPRRGDCKFLELRPGNEAELEYAPEGGRTYKLKLLGMHLARVQKPHGKGSSKRASGPSLGPDG